MSAEPREQHTHVEQYDGHTIVYDQGPTSWGAYVEDLPACFSVGNTFGETQHRIKEAIAIYLDELRRQDNIAAAS
jgi:predicted RNase H-like HicB family nuclease